MEKACVTSIRKGSLEDIDQINQVLEQAVMSWGLPERVKRLAIPSYRYHAYDMNSMSFYLAENASGEVIGVAALEAIPSLEDQKCSPSMLLHGLYVLPEYHHRGIGRQLLSVAEEHAQQEGFSGLMVKAQPEAKVFFSRNGYKELAVEDVRKDYQYRLWKSLTD
jgi:N-acetylglutamate synthase-like GNAT family acetyltransferase